MNADSNRIAKNTILLYIRQIVVLALGLYTTRLTLKVLGETDFGVYAAVGGITSLLTILTSSLSSGTQRFITFELGTGNKQKLSRIYVTSVNIHIILSVFLLIIGETVGTWFVLNRMTIPEERLITAFWIFQITLLNSVITLINVPNNAEIVAHEDMGIFAILTIVDSVLKLVAVILLFFITWDKLIVYSFSLFIIQFINRSLCFWYCKHHYEEARYYALWDKPLLKDMLRLSGWAGLTHLCVAGFIQGVNILLNLFFGPVMNAAYTVAMQAYSGIRSFCSNFQLAANPQITKLFSNGELNKMHKLICSVCKMSFFLIFFLSLPFLLNANFILQIWLGDVPNHAVSFFILLLIFAYIDVFAYPLDIAAQASGKLKTYSLAVSIGVIVVLPISYIAYVFGAVAESIYFVAIIMASITMLVRVKLLSKLIDLRPSFFISHVIIRLILTTFFSLIVPVVFSFFVSTSLISVVISFIISFISVAISVYLVGLDVFERQLVVNLLSSLKQKIRK